MVTYLRLKYRLGVYSQIYNKFKVTCATRIINRGSNMGGISTESIEI